MFKIITKLLININITNFTKIFVLGENCHECLTLTKGKFKWMFSKKVGELLRLCKNFMQKEPFKSRLFSRVWKLNLFSKTV